MSKYMNFSEFADQYCCCVLITTQLIYIQLRNQKEKLGFIALCYSCTLHLYWTVLPLKLQFGLLLFIILLERIFFNMLWKYPKHTSK